MFTWWGFFIEKKQKIYSNEFKRKAVAMYLIQGTGYKTIGKELAFGIQ
ncbi:transposase [Paenibacillus alvei]|nr:transposase [Paenibacillus alvei]MCY9582536.1 transposase [Paenibacillus alvei]